MAQEDEQPTKALTKNPLGPTGHAVAANVERLRKDQNLTYAALSERLGQIDRPIPPLGLRKIVAETRRVDVDDLLGLAVALNVSPISLLIPHDTASPNDMIEVTGVDSPEEAAEVWKWLGAHGPLGSAASGIAWLDFARRAFPQWRLRQAIEGVEQMIQLEREGKAADERAAGALDQWEKGKELRGDD
jgi:transcriptional regulator with XRE-family HTH domain